jgi:hypothetical protein
MPEANLFLVGLLLNFPWEILQSPLFQGMAEASHWEATKSCAIAAIGDAAVLVTAYWAAALVASSRLWILRPAPLSVATYLVAGLGITLLMERLAIAQGRWAYSNAMPVIPVLNIGLALVAQWLLLPPTALWIASRQILGGR